MLDFFTQKYKHLNSFLKKLIKAWTEQLKKIIHRRWKIS